MSRIAYFILLGSLVAAACAKTESENVRNSGLGLYADAVSDGTSTEVTARVIVGDSFTGTRLEMTGDDRLKATVGTEEKQLAITLNRVTNDVSYSATFETGASQQKATVVFERTIDATLPGNEVTVPVAFNVTAPSANQIVSRDAGFEVTWDNTDGGTEFSVAVTGNCIHPYMKVVPDNGKHTVGPNEIKPHTDPDGGVIDTHCPAVLTLSRTNHGKLDEGWGEKGQLLGVQRRKVDITSAP